MTKNHQKRESGIWIFHHKGKHNSISQFWYWQQKNSESCWRNKKSQVQKMKIVGQSITINVVWTINPLYSNFQAFLWIQNWPFIKSNRILVRFFQKKTHFPPIIIHFIFLKVIPIPGEVLLEANIFEKYTVFWLLQKKPLVRVKWWLFQKNHFLVINVESISTFWDE